MLRGLPTNECTDAMDAVTCGKCASNMRDAYEKALPPLSFFQSAHLRSAMVPGANSQRRTARQRNVAYVLHVCDHGESGAGGESVDLG